MSSLNLLLDLLIFARVGASVALIPSLFWWNRRLYLISGELSAGGVAGVIDKPGTDGDVGEPVAVVADGEGWEEIAGERNENPP